MTQKTIQQKTIQELFDSYVFESGRLNKDDAKITKNLIKKEILRRLKNS